MVAPRPRPVVPPTPITYPALQRVLGIKVVTTLTLWVAPALFLPPSWFPTFGIPAPPASHLVFVRLLGAAYLALVVGYLFAWQSPARHPSAVLVGVVSNGAAALVILSVGAAGGFATWGALGQVYIWGSAVLTAGLATGLLLTGRPLLRKLAERPRTRQ